MAKRVGISKAEAASGAAAELVALLESITDDGRIGNSEIKQLHAWIERNRDTGLGAVDYLAMTIESIAADGVVTDTERLELAKAVEKVLPPDVRDFAKQKRRLREMAARDTRTSAPPPPTTVDPNAAIGALDFVVAGVAYEGRSRIASSMQPGEAVFLIRDRGNSHSRNAIEVRTRHGYMIGFVPENDAVCLAPYLDTGHRLQTSVKKMWQGRECPIPIIEGEVFHPNSTAQGSYAEPQVPARRGGPQASKSGCLGMIMFGAGVGLAFLIRLVTPSGS